jgi:hypothetical protein
MKFLRLWRRLRQDKKTRPQYHLLQHLIPCLEHELGQRRVR